MHTHTHTQWCLFRCLQVLRELCVSACPMEEDTHTHTKSHKAYNSSTVHTVLRTQSIHIKHCYCQPIFTLGETVKVDIIYIICPYRQWPSYPTTSYFSNLFSTPCQLYLLRLWPVSCVVPVSIIVQGLINYSSTIQIHIKLISINWLIVKKLKAV